MGKILKRVLIVTGVLVVGAIGVGIVSGQASSLFQGAQVTATNMAIDVSGYKEKLSQTLDNNREAIAHATGMSLAEVDVAIANLDIENWQACSLPSDAVSTGSYAGDYAGISGTVTTYQDPGYVTVNASGQEITLEVPESAQSYLPYLAYL